MSNLSTSVETTPLRTSYNIPDDVDSDINRNQPVELVFSSKMDGQKQVMKKILIDFTILLIVALPILFIYLWGQPYQRGFFCNDESIRYPFRESTVKNWVLYTVGLGLPIVIIIITEIIHAKKNGNKQYKYKINDFEIPIWIVEAYKQIGVFGFGAACTVLTTDIAKILIGRLRPHFFSVCQPKMEDGSNCASPQNIRSYIENFSCFGSYATPRMIREMRLSFPSGHSSFAAYTMIYCAIYLHSRMTFTSSKLVKHFLQYLLILLAWFTALSRISDYKHHWSDVLAGGFLGSLIAVIVANFISNLFKKENKVKEMISMKQVELTVPATNNGRA